MRARREVVVGYVEFVAACRVLGVAHLLKGKAPSIEATIARENKRIAKLREQHKAVTEIPFPPLPNMIDGAEARFRRAGMPEDLEARVRKWADLKREEIANG